MQKVISGTSSNVQCSSSSGTNLKSSSSSELPEHAGVLPEEWSVSELKDKWQHTGLVGVCGELRGVMVTVL